MDDNDEMGICYSNEVLSILLEIQQERKHSQPTWEEFFAEGEIAYRRGYSQAVAHMAVRLDEEWLWDWMDDLYKWRYKASKVPYPEMEMPPVPK